SSTWTTRPTEAASLGTSSRRPSSRLANRRLVAEQGARKSHEDALPPRRRGVLTPRRNFTRTGAPLPFARVRIATWNVNSVKQRVPRLLPWLDQRQPDVVCLQETKLGDGAFETLLGEECASRGYAVALHGEAQWNGVAILSRAGLDDVVAGVPGAPGF